MKNKILLQQPVLQCNSICSIVRFFPGSQEIVKGMAFKALLSGLQESHVNLMLLRIPPPPLSQNSVSKKSSLLQNCEAVQFIIDNSEITHCFAKTGSKKKNPVCYRVSFSVFQHTKKQVCFSELCFRGRYDEWELVVRKWVRLWHHGSSSKMKRDKIWKH